MRILTVRLRTFPVWQCVRLCVGLCAWAWIWACVWLSASLLVPPEAWGQAPASVFLEDLTWTELRERIAAGHTIVIIPVGGTEQNGPAIALGKHNLRVKVLAERIARALGTALVAPVIAYVPEGDVEPPTAHMRFPGTITVPEHTFMETLESASRSFRRHGFRDIVLLGDHGGYQGTFTAVAERLNREWAATAVRVHALREYYRAGTTNYAQELMRRGYPEEEIGTHAGLADASLMLAVDAGRVRLERLRSGAGMDAAHGVRGDPRRASAELGQVGVELIVSQTVAAIQRAIARR